MLAGDPSNEISSSPSLCEVSSSLHKVYLPFNDWHDARREDTPISASVPFPHARFTVSSSGLLLLLEFDGLHRLLGLQLDGLAGGCARALGLKLDSLLGCLLLELNGLGG